MYLNYFEVFKKKLPGAGVICDGLCVVAGDVIHTHSAKLYMYIADGFARHSMCRCAPLHVSFRLLVLAYCDVSYRMQVLNG